MVFPIFVPKDSYGFLLIELFDDMYHTSRNRCNYPLKNQFFIFFCLRSAPNFCWMKIKNLAASLAPGPFAAAKFTTRYLNKKILQLLDIELYKVGKYLNLFYNNWLIVNDLRTTEQDNRCRNLPKKSEDKVYTYIIKVFSAKKKATSTNI